MLLERIINYLDTEEPGFSYIRDDPRMEIWVDGKEWFPILISKIHNRGYRISWEESEFEIEDEMKAYRYIRKVIGCIRDKKGKDQLDDAN